MHGFSDLVDALGGVEIEVTERVPIAIEGGPVEEWIDPGVQRMDGYHALWYARSRAGSSDYARMERQRQVQEAVISQFTPEMLLTKYAELSSAGQDMVQTDVPQAMIGELSQLALQTRQLPITNLVAGWGGQTVSVPYLDGHSTTTMIAAARGSRQPEGATR